MEKDRIKELYFKYRDVLEYICESELKKMNILVDNEDEWGYMRESLLRDGRRDILLNLINIIEDYASEKEE